MSICLKNLSIALILLIVLCLITATNVFAAGNLSSAQMTRYIDDLLIPEHVSDEIIVKFKNYVAINRTAYEHASMNAHKQAGASLKRKFKQVRGLELVTVPKRRPLRQALALYLNNPEVEYAEPNYLVSASVTPDDPSLGSLWGLHNTGQSGGTADADIDAPEAWDITTASNNVIVAVIDTGVDYAHEDLASNIWVNIGEIPDNGIDDDDNGYIDDDIGWDFSRCEQFNPNNICNVPKSVDNDPYDDNWHGTHCSGIIGAVGNNGTGVVGINWGIQIMPLKFLNSYGKGTTEDAINAIYYAVDNGASILSNSWGGSGISRTLEEAIIYANTNDVLFVASAGNDTRNNDVTPYYPASFEVPNVIAVAATDHNDNKPTWSNYGATSVDLAAPGVNVFSTKPGNSYGMSSGTSMAAPHVSGVAGLIKAFNPDLNNIEIIDIILNNVDVKASLSGKVASGGRLNAFNAVLVACPNLPVRIANTSLEYDSLQQAYNAAGSGDTIQAQAITFNETLEVNRHKTVTIVGGYDCIYSDNDSFSRLNGMNVTDGTLTIENFSLK